MRILKKLPKILCIFVAVVFSIFIIFNVSLFVKRAVTGELCPKIFGFTSAIVISGSMEPEISVNDYVLVCEMKQYKENEIIMYEGKNIPVTHRIEKIYKDENGTEWVVTKGDANNSADKAFESDKIIGKVVLVLPALGSLQGFFAKPEGFLLLTLVTGLLFCLPDIVNALGKKGKDGEGKDEKTD